MSPDFNKKIERWNTGSVKWEYVLEMDEPLQKSPTQAFSGRDPILPMWVADMDFASPDSVVEAIKQRAEHGIFGYTRPQASDLEAIVSWMKMRHAWHIQPEWIVTTPGVVPALHMLVRALTRPGDKVLIQRPVYYPFFSAIKENKCQIVTNSLVFSGNRYGMDFGDLEAIAADPQVKLAIFCNPHNPVGRVWTRSEILQFGEICMRNQVQVISDEIHADLIYPGIKFHPYASLNQNFLENSITCTAPSKTFNLAGLQTSNIIIPDLKLRRSFKKVITANGLFGVNPLGMAACRAAYEKGTEWLENLIAYLQENLDTLMNFFVKEIPEIRVIPPEGTYLVWLDCRSLGLENQQLNDLFLKQARVYLDDGALFGPEGDGFQRINIACPRSLLMEALERIAAAVKNSK